MKTYESECCQFILRGNCERDHHNFIMLQSCSFVAEGNIIVFMNKVPFIFSALILQSFLPIEGRTRGQHPICLCRMLGWCMQNGSKLETQRTSWDTETQQRHICCSSNYVILLLYVKHHLWCRDLCYDGDAHSTQKIVNWSAIKFSISVFITHCLRKATNAMEQCSKSYCRYSKPKPTLV